MKVQSNKSGLSELTKSVQTSTLKSQWMAKHCFEEFVKQVSKEGKEEKNEIPLQSVSIL